MLHESLCEAGRLFVQQGSDCFRRHITHAKARATGAEHQVRFLSRIPFSVDPLPKLLLDLVNVIRHNVTRYDCKCVLSFVLSQQQGQKRARLVQ